MIFFLNHIPKIRVHKSRTEWSKDNVQISPMKSTTTKPKEPEQNQIKMTPSLLLLNNEWIQHCTQPLNASGLSVAIPMSPRGPSAHGQLSGHVHCAIVTLQSPLVEQNFDLLQPGQGIEPLGPVHLLRNEFGSLG